MSYWYKGNLVITVNNIDRVREFLEHNFGLVFTKEQHGTGPEHYACEMNGKVFEIYPEDI